MALLRFRIGPTHREFFQSRFNAAAARRENMTGVGAPVRSGLSYKRSGRHGEGNTAAPGIVKRRLQLFEAVLTQSAGRLVWGRGSGGSVEWDRRVQPRLRRT